MTLKKYIEYLNTFAEKNPTALELPVIYAKDDEGNGFSHVYHKPTVGIFEVRNEEIKSVCIN